MTERRVAEGCPAGRAATAASEAERADAEPAATEAERDRPTLVATRDIPDEAEGERPARDLTGRMRLAVHIVAALLSAYALYNVFVPFTVLPYRMIFLAVILPLTFLL